MTRLEKRNPTVRWTDGHRRTRRRCVLIRCPPDTGATSLVTRSIKKDHTDVWSEFVEKSLRAFPPDFCSLLRAYRRKSRHNVPFPASRKFHLCSVCSSPHKAHSRFMGSPLPFTNKFHTCSLIGVFVHVHAAAENLFLLCFSLARKILRSFFDSL